MLSFKMADDMYTILEAMVIIRQKQVLCIEYFMNTLYFDKLIITKISSYSQIH